MQRKILFSNIPATYLIGAILGVLVGFILLMITLNAWNLYQGFTSDTSGQTGQYITINKKIGLINSLNSDFSAFTPDDIDSLKAQSFTEDLGHFVRSTFGVEASRKASGAMPYMRTEMFFEALPDRFLDKIPENWKWEKGQTHIPIIIPKEYLNLYNFGFAKAQGLPNVSEGIIGSFSFTITLYNRHREEQYTGSVVGFTNRIQSLLVPYEFLMEANSRFANQPQQNPHRLIIKIRPNTEKDLYAYLSNNGMETTHDAFQGGRVALFVSIGGTALLSVAVLIIILALIIYALTLQLTVQRNKDEVYQLILLGVRHTKIFLQYFVVQTLIAVIVFVISSFVVHLTVGKTLAFLQNRYIEIANFNVWQASATAMLVMGVFLLITGFNTYRLVKKLSLKGTI